MQMVSPSIITHFLLKKGELEISTLPNHAFPAQISWRQKQSCRAETDRPCVHDVFSSETKRSCRVTEDTISIAIAAQSSNRRRVLV